MERGFAALNFGKLSRNNKMLAVGEGLEVFVEEKTSRPDLPAINY